MYNPIVLIRSERVDWPGWGNYSCLLSLGRVVARKSARKMSKLFFAFGRQTSAHSLQCDGKNRGFSLSKIIMTKFIGVTSASELVSDPVLCGNSIFKRPYRPWKIATGIAKRRRFRSILWNWSDFVLWFLTIRVEKCASGILFAVQMRGANIWRIEVSQNGGLLTILYFIYLIRCVYFSPVEDFFFPPWK